jgi:hypothetical protein
MNTVERARHRWREILPLFGIDTRFLQNSTAHVRSAAARIGFGSMIATGQAPTSAVNAVPVSV